MTHRRLPGGAAPRAHRPRLPHWEEEGALYFITWVTANRLALPAAARDRVIQACRFFDRKRYRLWALVVVPDHVHAVIQPLPRGTDERVPYSLSSILHSLKSFSAHRVNEALERTGRVWQSRRYDRVIRNEADLREKLLYIVKNPVVAGLAETPGEYRWLYVMESSWVEL